MTVQELRDKLEEFHPELPVVTYYNYAESDSKIDIVLVTENLDTNDNVVIIT